MNVKSVEKETSKATVTVELTKAELEPAVNKADVYKRQGSSGRFFIKENQMKELPKTYEPKDVEARLYQFWSCLLYTSPLFSAGVPAHGAGQPGVCTAAAGMPRTRPYQVFLRMQLS